MNCDTHSSMRFMKRVNLAHPEQYALLNAVIKVKTYTLTNIMDVCIYLIIEKNDKMQLMKKFHFFWPVDQSKTTIRKPV